MPQIFSTFLQTGKKSSQLFVIAAVNLTAAGKLFKPKVNLVRSAKDLPIPVRLCVLETSVEATANEMFPQ